ncbi:pyrroline-5-carboxylate reductase [Bombilactobacillus folatiphilus]|uniref:Pyrroline-5-carboxylate reductase n=1 Tax=Bombilactobacillus folatiphilus TaxID=2923362 RepID=A0ABY4P972_9LACO|nr:pyrroline-5-carboxylate reductase [Bombilactobacillus folatiphilus]UQS82150.1 pyrroline-5-carboxylate reductase [Bombilactobacillus folatiphilus]
MKIGLIGAGRIGSALVKGLLKAQIEPDDIFVLQSRRQTAQKLAQQYHLNLVADTAQLQCDIVIIAIPGSAVAQVVKKLNQTYAGLIVSFAGGDLQVMNQSLQHGARFIKAVPNTAIEIGQGIVPLSFAADESAANKQLIQDLFHKVGQVYVVPEEQLGIYGTIAGCTPAYVGVMLEALSDAGVLHGMNREDSRAIILQMLAGTAQLAQEENMALSSIKDYSATPGGSTIRGVAALEEFGARNAFIQAVNASEK